MPIAAAAAAAATAAAAAAKSATKKKDKKKERRSLTKAERRDVLKIAPQKKRAKGVTREQHRKWKDEEKAKRRGIVRETLDKLKIKKKDD